MKSLVTLIIGTEAVLVEELRKKLGGLKEMPLNAATNILDSYLISWGPECVMVLARGRYGLIETTKVVTAFALNSLSPSLIIHVGTAGYTGTDIQVGEIAVATSSLQWDLNLNDPNFGIGELPGVKRGNPVPADLHQFLPAEVKKARLLSGNRIVDVVRDGDNSKLPGGIRSLITGTPPNHALVDMEGEAVLNVASTFGVDAFCLRVVLSNETGASYDQNGLLISSARNMAEVVCSILANLGRGGPGKVVKI